VWRTSFGTDRARLIGHPLDAAKLEAKLPRNHAALDMQLVRGRPSPPPKRFPPPACLVARVCASLMSG